MSKLLIKKVKIIHDDFNPQKRMDVLIEDGIIKEISPAVKSDDARIIKGRKMIMTAGLIDIHAHVAPTISLSVNPDDAGVNAGVTAVCDAGSLGWGNYKAGRKEIEKTPDTDVFHFLHLAPDGEKQLPEIGYELLDSSKIHELIKNNSEIIGIKIRAVENALKFKDYDVIEKAADIAHIHNIPLMIHLGDSSLDELSEENLYNYTSKFVSYLEKGDILTHAFTRAPGGIIRNGQLIDGVKDAVQRGVLLDIAPGMGHMSFEVLETALKMGLKPDLFGTDVVKIPKERQALTPHFYNVCAIASKLMGYGMSLKEVVNMMTKNPQKAIKKDGLSDIKVGEKANVTLIKKINGITMLHDGGANNLKIGKTFLSPQMLIKGNRVFEVKDSIKNHRADPISFIKLAESARR